MDRLFLLEVFVRVVDRGSISAAARDLDLPQPTVSRHIKTLEQEFSARLIERTTHSNSLTDAGALLYERAKRVIDEYESAEDLMGENQRELTGRLKLNAPVTLGERHIARLLTQFQLAYPKLSVELTLTDRFVDLVEEGVDAAIRTATLDDIDYVARPLGHLMRGLYASPGYLAQFGTPAHPDDLAGHRLLMFGLLKDYGALTLKRGVETAHVAVSRDFRTNNGAALIAAFVTGYGMGEAATALVAQEIEAGTLVRVLPEWTVDQLPVYFMHPRTRYLKPKIKALGDFLAHAVPLLPGVV